MSAFQSTFDSLRGFPRRLLSLPGCLAALPRSWKGRFAWRAASWTILSWVAVRRAPFYGLVGLPTWLPRFWNSWDCRNRLK